MFLHNGGLLPWKELPIKPFKLKRSDLESQRKLLEMEVKWLVLRQKIALAEIDAKLAKESEVRLALEMARFGEMEKMLPGRKASLSGQRWVWETRLALGTQGRNGQGGSQSPASDSRYE